MQYLRLSTTSQVITLGPFVDRTDGFTAETGLTINNTDIKLRKNAATTYANKNSGGATHITNGNGVYHATLDDTDTNTLGRLEIFVFLTADALPVWKEFMVLPAVVYDAMILGTDLFQVDVTQIDGAATSGNNATLNLKQLNIVNNAGDALVATSSGSNGRGIHATGNGTGGGLRCVGGATGNGVTAQGGGTSGIGISAIGIGAAAGIYAQGGVTGNGVETSGGITSGHGIESYAIGGTASGIYAQGGSNDGPGITAEGIGNGAGVRALGGATGHGIEAVAGGATADGIRATGGAASGASAGGHGVNATGGAASTTGGGTAGVALRAVGGAGAASTNVAAAGLTTTAGADNGAGGANALTATATGNGHGLRAAGAGSGEGISAQGGATGHGIEAIGGEVQSGLYVHSSGLHGFGILAEGGSANGFGILVSGPEAAVFLLGINGAGLNMEGSIITNSPGVQIYGGGSGAGIQVFGGATGHGIEAIGGVTSGDGINASAASEGDGLKIVGAGSGAALGTAGRDAIADAVWDEALAGHTTGGTAGKALLRSEQFVAHDGTAQDGGASTITLDAGASDEDDYYVPGLIVLTGGPGAGQFRRITAYNGSSSPVKVATVATPWITLPTSATEFAIFPWASVRVSELDEDVLTTAAFAGPKALVVTDGGNSPTQVKTDRTEAVTDFWTDGYLLLLSGALAGQVKKISAYDGTNKIITVTGGFTATPADGVELLIINR